MTFIEELLFGQYGADVITNTSQQSPPTGYKWIAVQCVTDCVFESLTCEGLRVNGSAGSPAGTHSAVSLPVGIYYGKFTALKLTSGSVIAYQGRKEA